MENTSYVALSRQMVLRNSMDIVANNIANVNTPGFRAQNSIFAERISDPQGTDAPLSFVSEYGQYQNTDPGPLTQTDNPLDIALTGQGFIGVQDSEGKTAYTRAGNFHLDQEGTLLTATGHTVLDDGGSPIEIPDDSTEIKIDEHGIISNQDGEIAQIMIHEFDNEQTLNPVGDSLYVTTEEGHEAENTVVKQGYLEGSNVRAITEMTRMIDILRSYQSTQRLVQTEHDRLREAIQTLTRTGQ